MTDIENGVWFVYDGECPICGYAAHALRIKQAYGALHLPDARREDTHPLLALINEQKFDLDEGMVIYSKEQFYHGEGALQFMARFGETSGALNIVNKCLFWSKGIAAIMYPWMRGARNLLLRYLNKSKIDNLDAKSAPIFQPVFGQDWDKLPTVLKKHYANRPYSRDKVSVEGVLDVSCRSYMRFLQPFYRLMGSIPAHNENNVRVSVDFDSEENSKAFCFNRTFFFSTTKPYRFHSRMIHVGGNEVIEMMRLGICWRMHYSWDGNKVSLRHNGYALNILGRYVPLPVSWLLGRGDADEIAVDDDTFDMQVSITHPMFGVVYSYAGRFKVIDRQ